MNEQNMESLQKAIENLASLFNCGMAVKKGNDEELTVEYKKENLNKSLFSGALFRLVLHEFEIRNCSLFLVNMREDALVLGFEELQQGGKQGGDLN
ncbi:MAG: hypothetical protein RE472_00615 [Thermoplasmatales archaeon]|nr:MAG: hypothetical protein RE472_00615 [Thermoplasmatales archaeon]